MKKIGNLSSQELHIEYGSFVRNRITQNKHILRGKLSVLKFIMFAHLLSFPS